MERIVLVIENPVLRNRVSETLTELGAPFVAVREPAELGEGADPTCIVVELELEGAVDAIQRWKRRWPSSFIVGALSLPRQDLWNAGRAAGCALVVNAGAVPRQLRRRLEEARSGAGAGLRARRLKVLLSARPGDGLVAALPDAPDGGISVFRAEGRLCAIQDACPHAGASLGDGELESTVVTCPAHGSQFDVRDGTRVRGPSDFPVRTYPVVEEDGEVWVELV